MKKEYLDIGFSAFTFLDSEIILANKNRASQLLGTSDEFTRELSAFDLTSRLGFESENETDYLDFASKQARDWHLSEALQLETIFKEIETKVLKQNLHLSLPKKIEIIKSTLKEEGGASGYTRGDYIVFDIQEVSEHLVIHELFHILSRFSPQKKDQIYYTIGFKRTNIINFPESLFYQKITNPDAPTVSHFIELEIEGTWQEAAIEIYSENKYIGGSFFAYLSQKLMILEGGESGLRKAKLIHGQPIMKPFESAPFLKDKIGNMTNYTLHPEEICAEHFVKVINNEKVSGASNYRIVNDFREILKKNV